MVPRIPVNQKELIAFCRRQGIRKLAFFGSVLREDFRPGSDVDVLVEFEPEVDRHLTCFRLARMQAVLERLQSIRSALSTCSVARSCDAP